MISVLRILLEILSNCKLLRQNSKAQSDTLSEKRIVKVSSLVRALIYNFFFGTGWYKYVELKFKFNNIKIDKEV